MAKFKKKAPGLAVDVAASSPPPGIQSAETDYKYVGPDYFHGIAVPGHPGLQTPRIWDTDQIKMYMEIMPECRAWFLPSTKL